jgi:uncharacterized damage-inducible protein DinB
MPNDQTQELEHKLVLEREKLLAVLKTFSDAEMLQPVEEGWSVKDIVAHIAASEQLNVHFARLMLEQDRPVQLRAVAFDYPDYEGEFDLDRFNAYMRNKQSVLSLEQVRESLAATRRATMAWLETLTAEQLERTGKHAVWGEQSVRSMCKILVLHDKMHAQELAKRSRRGE